MNYWQKWNLCLLYYKAVKQAPTSIIPSTPRLVTPARSEISSPSAANKIGRTLRHSTDKADRLVLAGLIVIFITVVIETIATYYVVTLSGIFLGIGLLILLFINILRTIARIRNLELERRQKEMHRRREQMEKLSLQVLRTLSTTIETKDEYTRGHSHRVGEYAALIARELGWSQEEIINLKNTADLHDIGKIGVPDTILNKPTKLTEDEYIIIKDHTVIGAEILKNITLMPHAAEVARRPHERYDGTGYPDGLKGEDIPLYARVIAVADSYDAMSSRRIYRSVLSRQEICEEIRSNQGKQFDPVIAEVFLRLLTEDRLQVQEADSTTPENADQPNMEFEIGKFVSDIMQTMKAQEDSDNFDFLTGLPLRSAGEKLTARLMEEHDGCLIFMDMDNLKQINDIYGHKAGDRALKAVSYTHLVVIDEVKGPHTATHQCLTHIAAHAADAKHGHPGVCQLLHGLFSK